MRKNFTTVLFLACLQIIDYMNWAIHMGNTLLAKKISPL